LISCEAEIIFVVFELVTFKLFSPEISELGKKGFLESEVSFAGGVGIPKFADDMFKVDNPGCDIRYF
jgi:hypothetical protein